MADAKFAKAPAAQHSHGKFGRAVPAVVKLSDMEKRSEGGGGEEGPGTREYYNTLYAWYMLTQLSA